MKEQRFDSNSNPLKLNDPEQSYTMENSTEVLEQRRNEDCMEEQRLDSNPNPLKPNEPEQSNAMENSTIVLEQRCNEDCMSKSILSGPSESKNNCTGARYFAPNLPEFDVFPSEIKEKKWGFISHRSFCDEITKAYDEIVHFRRNIFNIPSGRAGKNFIGELTYWLKQFNCNSDLNSIALKAFMVLPPLILQKPSATSKSKEHSAAIERRLALWRQGDLNLLMKEVRFIQDRFVTSKKIRSTDDISRVFARLVLQGKLSAAIKFLDKESSAGLLDPSPEILEGLKEKHPPASEVKDESLLNGPVDRVPPSIYDLINEQMIYDAAMRTKGSAGPSGMDAELYRRILCSKNFSSEGKILREEISMMTRNLMKTCYHPSLLEGYTSYRLIPLDKRPGVGEVLRRIIGKTITSFLKEEIKEAAGSLQVCAGHSGGAEAAIHAMSHVFEEEGTDGIILIDATNAFNQMNRAIAMHNLQITCNKMSLYIINTYRSPSRLFICGGGEILSQEGTTQGDPLAMPWYSVNTSIVIQSLRLNVPEVKQVWLADDSAGGGRLINLYSWYKHLEEEGKKFGYLVNGPKCWLIVKSQELAEEARQIFGKEVNITTEGKRHLGAVIGSKDYKDEYCRDGDKTSHP